MKKVKQSNATFCPQRIQYGTKQFDKMNDSIPISNCLLCVHFIQKQTKLKSRKWNACWHLIAVCFPLKDDIFVSSPLTAEAFIHLGYAVLYIIRLK